MRTIVAQSSPPGRSDRAIIRLSGDGVFQTLASVVSTPENVLSAPPVSRPIARRIVLQIPTGPREAAFDAGLRRRVPALAIFSWGPRSYTGEDSAELLLPGNDELIRRVLATLNAAGAASARPGEFTARAHAAGRLTLDQAEGVMALIAAERDDELAAAADLLSGHAGGRYRAMSDELIGLLALVEAGVDFTDQEDVVPIAPAALVKALRALADRASAAAQSGAGADATPRLPRVVFVGPPNGGKSTLFNTLLCAHGHGVPEVPRSIASPIPGTTRDAITETLNCASGPILLTDLAGLTDPALGGATAGPTDAAAQDAARAHIAAADLIVHCDPTGLFTLELPAVPTLHVRTKADLASESDAASDGTVLVAAPIGLGLGELVARIDRGTRTRSVAGGLPDRHRVALDRAAAAIAAAADAVDRERASLAEPELVAAEMRAALDALGEVTGWVTSDDVLGRVFSAFCVGK